MSMRLAPALVALFTCACVRTVVVGGCPTGELLANGTCSSTPSREDETWGDFITGLDLTSCPSGETWVVNTASNELDGGPGIVDAAEAGSRLSLPEAVRIAANRPGQDNITFDEAVFSAQNPATVEWPLGFSINLSDACIDARARGVVVNFVENNPSVPNPWSLGDNTLLVGITFLGGQGEQLASASSQVAACRYGATDSGAVSVAPALTSRGLVGPANVFCYDAYVDAGAVFFENYFNVDPRTQRSFPLNGIFLYAAATPGVNASVLRSTFGPIATMNWSSSSNSTVLIEACIFDGSWASISRGNATVRDCQFHNSSLGISIGSNGQALATRTTFTSIEGPAISYVGASPPPFGPPTVLDAGPTVSGTCSGAGTGTVELFATRSDDADIYLASATCVANDFSVSVDQSQLGSGTWFITATYSEAGATSVFSDPFPL